MGEEGERVAEIAGMIREMDKGIIDSQGLAWVVATASVAIMTWYRFTEEWACAGENRTNGPSRS